MTDYDKVAEEISVELFDVWKEAKYMEGDDWDGFGWESLPEKHKDEYRKTAERIIRKVREYLKGEKGADNGDNK